VWLAVRLVYAHLAWAGRTAGYWVRPYDQLADRRRWRWQARHWCGLS